jgi:hypothetical protein
MIIGAFSSFIASVTAIQLSKLSILKAGIASLFSLAYLVSSKLLTKDINSPIKFYFSLQVMLAQARQEIQAKESKELQLKAVLGY